MAQGLAGKRVAWVELYLDLVFVLAASQLAHVLEAHPDLRHLGIAFGLFVALWWTWIGFATLYNRLGEDSAADRLILLAGSVPIGVAAVAIEPAVDGDWSVFALSLGAARLVLAGAHARARGDGLTGALRNRVSRAYGVSAALIFVSIALPSPWCYILCGIAIAGESAAVLSDPRRGRRANHDLGRHDADPDQLARLKPQDPAEALDAHHFSERFGLFLIILLGEVVVSAGHGAVDGHVAGLDGWLALAAAMVLAAALWWLYFDAAVDLNRRVLELSGGSPVIARALFAIGHMLPAFALLMIAAGTGLLLAGEAPPAAYTLPAVGLGIYLLGTRVTLAGRSAWARVAHVVVLVTFFLGRLEGTLSPHAYLGLLAAWAVGCAALAWRGARDALATGAWPSPDR